MCFGRSEIGNSHIHQHGSKFISNVIISIYSARSIQRSGNSGIIPSGEPEQLVDRMDAGVAQGFVEDSNVNPVLEMTRLIAVQRAFENTSAMIRANTSSLDQAIQTLGSK